jgi:hypothetical protein
VDTGGNDGTNAGDTIGIMEGACVVGGITSGAIVGGCVGDNKGAIEGTTVSNGAKVGLFEATSKGATVKPEVGISVIGVNNGASVGNAVTEARGDLEGRLDLLGLLVGDEETGE